jgi:hypothetical protein
MTLNRMMIVAVRYQTNTLHALLVRSTDVSGLVIDGQHRNPVGVGTDVFLVPGAQCMEDRMVHVATRDRIEMYIYQ